MYPVLFNYFKFSLFQVVSKMEQVPSAMLSSGYKMPMLGLGTHMAKGEVIEETVKIAVEVGYRHIDTAEYYDNEKFIGNAVRSLIDEGKIQREDLFISTKVWNTHHEEKGVVRSCRNSLEKLGLDYIDLYLIHWPFAYKEGEDPLPKGPNDELLFSDVDYLETWRGMEECVRLGLARSIGVSNFNSEQLARLIESAKIPPSNNQIEVSVNLNQEKLIDFCKKYNVAVTGYSPLGRPNNRFGVKNSLDDPKILEIAKKYEKTPAQVAIRYVYQQGAAPIPKSVTKSRLIENMEVFDFALTPEDMETIKNVGTGDRVCLSIRDKEHKYYPFNVPY